MELMGVDKKGVGEADMVLTRFNEQKAKDMKFELRLGDRKEVWVDLFRLLDKTSGLRLKCLNCARILSRDKSGLNESITEEMVNLLMELSGMDKTEAGQNSEKAEEETVRFEAVKVLSNLIHQSSVVQSYCTRNGFLSKIFKKIQTHPKTRVLNSQVKVFDFRLVFLFTALCPEQRDVAKHNHNGVKTLNDALDNILEEKSSMDEPTLTEEDCDVVCEILKVVFNLTVNSTEEDLKDLKEVAANVNRLLRINITNSESKYKVINNCVNVVTNMDGRVSAYKELVRSTDIQLPAEPDLMCQGLVMNSVQAFLDLLSHKMDHRPPGSSLKEDLTPILSVLYNICRSVRLVRKYVKSVVLPPLRARDLKEKPEDGNSLKSRLVSLLTNSSSDISIMVAEFLFILCKENVQRLIKHIGYGNAAGTLANKGLMAGGRSRNPEYSSDSDSDTEEYKRERDKVNPVTGRVEDPVVSPLEGMSEEQKEYEAVMLANLIDKMSRAGVIQPCRVGEDGRPEAVEHVQQLLEGQQGKEEDEEED